MGTSVFEGPGAAESEEVDGPGAEDEGGGGSASARAWEMACLMKRPAAALSTTREPGGEERMKEKVMWCSAFEGS